MAGYLFAIGDGASVQKLIGTGLYATRMNLAWSNATEGTLGDYVTMSPGDNVYFFSKRNVYGIGEILETTPGEAVFENRAGATSGEKFDYSFVSFEDSVIPEDREASEEDLKVNRWGIAFKPSPAFFRNPIDMDDLLSSNPGAFRSLRVFWRRSFIKLDDEENRAFKAALLRKNLDIVRAEDFTSEMHCPDHFNSAGKRKPQPLSVCTAAKKRMNPDGSFKSEMMLEVCLLDQLHRRDQDTVEIFGSWDYLSHQVKASPMKAVDYMDAIDVFGYSWIKGYEGEIIGDYLVAELKKDGIGVPEVNQVMKYVDWVGHEYASGNYELINAFLVGSQIDAKAIGKSRQAFERRFLTQRPPVNHVWNNLTFVEYRVSEDGCVSFEIVEV